MKQPLSIFWFRRDLRLDDNVGFYEALKSDHSVLPIFIFDSEILEQLPENDTRVTFIYDALQMMRKTLQEAFESSIAMFHGKPIDIYKRLIDTYNIYSVYTNHDYEPYAKERDNEIKKLLSKHQIVFKTFKDQVIFEKDDIVKKDGTPYKVYTPYMKLWKSTFRSQTLEIRNTKSEFKNLISDSTLPNLNLSEIGFTRSLQQIPEYEVTPILIQTYEETRNFPAKDSTSRLGPHLRFGTVSIRKMVKKAVS